MNTVRQAGSNPTFGSIQEAGAQAPIGQVARAPVTPAAPAQLDPKDQVSQTAGVSGRAAPVDLVATPGPQNAQIRALLANKDFDGLAALVNRLGVRGIGKLDLSLEEIKAIAVGLGQGSINPLVRFTTEEVQAVQSLVMASQLDPNQKFEGLNSLLGAESLMTYARTATPASLSKLSQTNRQTLMNLMISGSSAMGTVAGAYNEIVNRRVMGQGQQVEDRLASKILRSTHSESELRELLNQMNQFSRDDVAFRYVMDLSAEELAGLSDNFKKDLMANLIDTGVSFYGLNIDLNSMGNIDEMLNMTFKEHAEAAKRLYVALRPETRQSKEVQTLVAKSDVLMQQIKDIESSLTQDLKGGKLNQAKIDSYRTQLQSLQTAQDPEVKKKVGELLETLTRVQTELQQASQTRQLSTGALSQAHQQLAATQASLQNAQKQVQGLNSSIQASAGKIDEAEAKLIAQLRQLSDMRGNAGQLGDELKDLLGQVEPLLQNSKPGALRAQMPKVDALLAQIKQAEAKLQGLSSEQTEIHQQLSQLSTQIGQQRQDLGSKMAAFNTDRTKLQQSTKALGQLLQTYNGQIDKLEKDYSTARTQLDALDQTALPEAQRAQLQKDLDAARNDIDSHQASYQKLSETLTGTLVPAAEKIEAAAPGLQAEAATAEQGLTRLESKVETVTEIENTAAAATVQVQSALDQVKEKASTLRQNLTARIPDMTAKQLKSAQAEIDQMVQALRQEDPSGAQIQEDLMGLGMLKEQIQAITDAINNSSQVQAELGANLKAISTQGNATKKELEHAQQALTQANSEVSSAQQSVAKTQENLKTLTASLDKYEVEIQSWTDELKQLDQQNTSSKDSFMKTLDPLRKDNQASSAASLDPALRTQIEQEKQKLTSTFSSVDAQRQAIQSKLTQLKSEMAGIGTEMTHQREKLVSYQSTLQAKTTALAANQKTVLDLSDQLNKSNMANRNLLKETQAKLDSLSKQPKNKQVIAALADVNKKITALKAQLQKADELAEKSGTQINTLLLLNRDSAKVQQDLQQSISAIDSFVSGDLSSTSQAVDQVDQHFQELNAEKAQIQQKVQQLMQRLAGGGINMEQMRAEMQDMFSKVKDSQTLTQLEGMGKTLMGAMQTLEQGKGLLEQNAALRSSATTLGAQAGQEVAAMRNLLSQLGGEANQMESEVQSTQQALLTDQKNLLEQRRQMGIAVPGYQAALKRASELLNSGKPLTKEQVQELAGLESQMSSIESGLAQTSQDLSDRITSMNMLKARVNTRIDELNHKIAHLQELRGKMVELRSQLGISRTSMSNQLQDLRSRRESLVQAIDQLSKQQGIKGLAEYQQLMSQLQSALKDIDTQLAGFEGSIKSTDEAIVSLDTGIKDLDETLVAANNLRAKLEMVKGKVAEVLEQLEKTKSEVDGLLKLADHMLQDIKHLEKQLEPLVETTGPQPSTQNSGTAPIQDNSSNAQLSAQQRSELQKQSLANRLSNQLTSFWGSNQRQSDARREADHQARRQALSKELEQYAKQANQYQIELAEKHAHSDQLAAINAHLVEQALVGANLSSGLNVV